MVLATEYTNNIVSGKESKEVHPILSLASPKLSLGTMLTMLFLCLATDNS